MHDTDDTALAAVRDQVLRDALGECLPLAHVDGVVARLCPGETLPEQQELVLRAVRSLLDEGLVVVGDIVGGSDERVEPWDLMTEYAVAQIHDRYVDHHDDQTWSFNTWFALIKRGQHLAKRLGEQPG
jgi:hypothetical protein